LILSTPHRFIGVQGLAGTGKSHMLVQVKEAAEAAGYKVQAMASYGKQIEALHELGMEAKTVAAVLEARQKERFKLNLPELKKAVELAISVTRVVRGNVVLTKIRMGLFGSTF
jgi:thymidylate kinase